MLRKIGAFMAGLSITAVLFLILALRIVFGLALYIIAFGAAYIILWELGVL